MKRNLTAKRKHNEAMTVNKMYQCRSLCVNHDYYIKLTVMYYLRTNEVIKALCRHVELRMV